MLWWFLLVVVLGGFSLARGSEKIEAPAEGASVSVTQPHVVAELIPERTSVQAGEPFGVILHLHMDPEWHTYWINPGDAGIPTMIKWTLPAGFTAGPIQWPTPEVHAMGPLVTYGYDGDAYLLTMITPPKSDLPQHFEIKAKAEWLVCKEECIPGKAEFSLGLDSGLMNLRLPAENTELFKETRERLPAENKRWLPNAKYAGDRLIIEFTDVTGAEPELPKKVYFFPEQTNVLSPNEDSIKIDRNHPGGGFTWSLALEQNGDKPNKISGVLVSDEPLLNSNVKAVRIAEFPVATNTANATPGSGANANEPASGPAAATHSSAAQSSGAGASEPVARRSTATAEPATLVAYLGAAFVGGIILNLMPCVLPVLSLKVFSLIKHAGEHPERAWRQGVAFTIGVVVSFWVLAGVLLALRAAGQQLGWGFQMQSPGFVAGLIVLFFLLGLNLFGVFEIGSSLVGVDARAAGQAGGGVSSFLNGALATVAATPCTAPFMGSALGFAAQQSAAVSLLVFTFLALGMAAPYLLLTLFPQSLRFVPKPGAWMESLKQFMGFLLMGTVIFLVYVFGALKDGEAVIDMLGVLLLLSVGAWIYGRWGNPCRSMTSRVVGGFVCVVILIGATVQTVALVNEPVARRSTATTEGWQPWSPEAVKAALGKGQPVFVDFTAAWCLSCKVNERVALDNGDVKRAFAEKKVALFRADWTHSDPAISEELRRFNRDGVPLYLLYSPKAPEAPQVLPEVLTPGIVLEALGRID